MAISLDYQTVYVRGIDQPLPVKVQVFAALCLFVALACKVWIKLESTDLGYQLARERQRTVSLDMERRELDLKLSVILRSDTLSQLAEKRLGLSPLDPKQARKVRY